MAILRKNIIRLAALLFLSPILIPGPVYAGSSGSGYIWGIIVGNGGFLYFFSTGTRYEQPLCAAGTGGRYVLNVSTLAGQSAMSTILAAYVSQQKVQVFGAGTCTQWGDSEDMSFVQYTD